MICGSRGGGNRNAPSLVLQILDPSIPVLLTYKDVNTRTGIPQRTRVVNADPCLNVHNAHLKCLGKSYSQKEICHLQWRIQDFPDGTRHLTGGDLN